MKRKNNVFTIMKKELRRIFGDRRLLMSLFLPGLLIYALYSIMGEAIIGNLIPSEDDTYTVSVAQMPASVQAMLGASDYMPLRLTDTSNAETARDAVEAGELDLYVVFPTDFDSTVAVYDPATGTPAPEVQIYYNSSSTTSTAAYSYLTAVLDAYESSMANRFDINRTQGTYDLAKPEDLTGMFMSMLMPMLLTMLLFSGCMAVAPESIAGEKERGTLGTLLVTPMKRWELALGKIGALSVVALMSGLWSFVGVMLALPKLMGGEASGMINTTIYGVTDYVCLLCVILSTTLVFISLISVLSALARSVKEATGMVSPMMILVVLICFSDMLIPGADTGTLRYLIPVYNSTQCISNICQLSYRPTDILITAATNLIVAGILAVVLTKLFNSEKVMFKR